MSDWYLSQLARQDQYGDTPPANWPEVYGGLTPDERGLQPQTATIGPAEMRSYTPTLGERLKGGLSDLFRSGGADTYNAGKLGDIAATGLSLLPPVGYSVAKSEMEHGVEGRNPTGIALGALGAIPGAKGVMGELASPFYSAAGRAVENAKLGKGTADQWLGYLRNQPGVKPEELNYVFGNLPEGQLTKAQMQAHAAENAVTLGEKNLGDNTQLQMKLAHDVIKEKAQIQRLGNEWDAAQPAARTQIETEMNLRHDRIRELENESRGLPERNSKYDQWQLPGGENYRETLLTLPVPEWKPPGDEGRVFRSSHWDEPNVLAHVRTNDREIPGVGKSLHVEEIQSDWHQKGRSSGYQTNKVPTADDVELKFIKGNPPPDAVDKSVYPGYWESIDKSDGSMIGRHRGDMTEAEALAQAIGDLKHKARNTGVPDAPFKSTWADVALKRQIREASEKGYDAISWTPGKAQAARYPDALRQAVNNISWSSPGAGGRANPDGLRYVHAQPTGGGTDLVFTINKDGAITEASSAAAKGKHVEDIFGKDMAKQIMGEAEGDIASKDFVIGAKGMEGFYDKMLVDKANAIGKKHGARVEQTEMFEGSPEKWKPVQGDDGRWHLRHTEDGFDASLTFPTREAAMAMMDEGKRHAVHVLRITPELRAAAMKGFPLFTAGGVVAGGTIGELARQDKYGRNE